MRRLVVVAVLVIAAALLYRASFDETTGTGDLTLPPPEPNEGTPVGSFVARSAEGGTFEMTDRGVYVLSFWSALNRKSNQARPEFIELAREYGNDASFAVIYVNGVVRDREVPYDRLEDPKGTLASRYNIKRVPRLFVIRDGEVAFTQDEDAYLEGYEDILRQEIEDALEEEAGEDRPTALNEN